MPDGKKISDQERERLNAALRKAAEKGDVKAATSLIGHGADVNGGALAVAAGYGELEVAKLLIQRGANVNGTDPNNGITPLIAVTDADKNKLPMVKLLIHSGADVNKCDESPWVSQPTAAPIHYAAGFDRRKGDPAIIKILIDNHAVTDVPDGNGETPLMMAARRGNNHVVKALLDGGVDPNARGNEARSPLHNAALCHRGGDVTAMLLAKGADPFAKDDYGQTPLDIARKEEAPSYTIKLLEAAMKKPAPQKQLPKKKADVNSASMTFPAQNQAIIGEAIRNVGASLLRSGIERASDESIAPGGGGTRKPRER